MENKKIDTTENLDLAAEPTVTIIFSENQQLREGDTFPLFRANALIEALDKANLANPGYDKTAFRIDCVMNGQPDHYEGRQNLGDGDGTLINHIEKYHAYYENNKEWDNYILRNKGKEALEADKAQREMLLHEFVPYLKLHCNLSFMESLAAESLQTGEKLTHGETAYYTAIQAYVAECRGLLNQGEYNLPPVPQLKDFVTDKEEEIAEITSGHDVQKLDLEGVREARENEPISIFNIRMNDEERWFKNTSGLDAEGLCKAYAECDRPFVEMGKYGEWIDAADYAYIEQEDRLDFSIEFNEETDQITIFDGKNMEYKGLKETLFSQAEQPETTVTYYPINEDAACRAKEAISFSDYKPGSATAEYRHYVDEAAELAARQKKLVDPSFHEKIDGLLDAYARKLAANMNKGYEITARVPSVMIVGGSNFPVRKKEKQNAAADKNMQEFTEIQGLLDKIRSTGMGGISANDPNAVSKLESKLAELEALQETMKAVNAYYRKHKTLDGCPDLSPEQIEKMKASMSGSWRGTDPKPFESYELSNNNAEIHRLKGRITALTRRKELGYVGWEFAGGRVEANTADNRLQIFFDEKPDKEIREELKGNGFHYAPSVKAWQRQLNDNALYAANRIKYIQPLTGESPIELQKRARQETAKQHNDCFVYQGYHFKPLRQFTKTEDDFFEITSRLKCDDELGMLDMDYYGKQKTPYSYEEFYAASTDKEADIFLCLENQKEYVPCEHELQEYMQEPEKRRGRVR